MSLLLLVLSFFVTPASAEDLPKGTLPLKSVGAVANLQGCEAHVLASTTKAANTVKTVVGVAQAQAICKEAEGDLEIAKAEAQAIKDGSAAEAGLVNAAGIAVMNGDPMSYDRVLEPDGTIRTHLATGPAGTVHELAAVAAALDPRLTGYGYGQYGVYNQDPNLVGLARLSGIPLGTTMPFATGTPATAPCGTADQCQAKVAALQSALAQQQ